MTRPIFLGKTPAASPVGSRGTREEQESLPSVIRNDGRYSDIFKKEKS
jgi:hypothetical protein